MIRGEMTYTLDELDVAADFVLNTLATHQVIAIIGALGAGKTTLVQALFKKMGIEAPVQSPTFTYVTEYTTPDAYTCYHFDLYRLKSLQEFLDQGFGEYLYQPRSYAFIEWPESIISLLKKSVCFIAIDYVSEDTRRMRYEILL